MNRTGLIEAMGVLVYRRLLGQETVLRLFFVQIYLSIFKSSRKERYERGGGGWGGG